MDAGEWELEGNGITPYSYTQETTKVTANKAIIHRNDCTQSKKKCRFLSMSYFTPITNEKQKKYNLTLVNAKQNQTLNQETQRSKPCNMAQML